MIYENRSDGLLTLLGKQTMTFNETKKFCASIPGHRMAMTKKKTQIEVLKNLQNRAGGAEIWVDLVKSDVGLAIWGDRTPYEDTEASQVATTFGEEGVLTAFRFKEQHFHDRAKSIPFLPLCQANPLDSDEW
ncbi:hypothetical protein Pcinc_019467 [Petrolisthes cinctipes]|uniref:Uncharacterized protein n=1 Tax=Petrolisthes cinctipes TaxID=88211 RepID=A0AAE1FLH7_PETCI|nr:hypothetical protein Pcinc_019467 [Petrolisthes cinctipes]